MVAINPALDLYFLWEVNFPFLNSCLYWLACLRAHCPWVASTGMQTKLYQGCPKSWFPSWFSWKFATFLSHSSICKSYVLNESSSVDFCTIQRKFPFSLFEIYSPTWKNIQDYYAHFYQFPLECKIWFRIRPSQIKSCTVIIPKRSKEALEGVFVLDKYTYTRIWMYTVRGSCETSCIMSCSCKSAKNGGGFYFPPGKLVNNGQFLLLMCLRKRALKL